MIFSEKQPPRVFEAGRGTKVRMKDCGDVKLEPNEQLTFTTELGAEYDVARKEWGFYATPSLNGRLISFGLRTVLVKNFLNKFYILLVEKGSEHAFYKYLNLEELEIVSWLDTDSALEIFEKTAKGKSQ